MRAKLALQGSEGLDAEDVICFFVGLSGANKLAMSNGRLDEVVFVSFVSFASWSSRAISAVCPRETRIRQVN